MIIAGYSNKIKKEGQYFLFRIDGTKVMQINSYDKCHFWNNLLPDLKQNLSIISMKSKYYYYYYYYVKYSFIFTFRSNRST